MKTLGPPSGGSITLEFDLSFKENLAQDVEATFLNADEFAEVITYSPADGSPKALNALVIRKGLEVSDENYNRSLRRQAEVYIANSVTNGVTQIDKKDDRITLDDLQGSSVTARILEILDKDDGLWHLLVSW